MRTAHTRNFTGKLVPMKGVKPQAASEVFRPAALALSGRLQGAAVSSPPTQVIWRVGTRPRDRYNSRDRLGRAKARPFVSRRTGDRRSLNRPPLPTAAPRLLPLFFSTVQLVRRDVWPEILRLGRRSPSGSLHGRNRRLHR